MCFVRLLALLLVAGQAGAAGLHFAHKDWELACDNTGTCRAAGYQDETLDGPAVSVLVVREAGAGAAVTGRVHLGTYDEAASKAMPSEVAMSLNGRSLGAVRLRDAQGELSPSQVSALVAALVQKADTVFSAAGRQWRLSDQGAAAVFLKMDEAQRRLGTMGALIRKGRQPETAVPAPIPMPVVRAQAIAPRGPADPTWFKRLRSLLAATKGAQDCLMSEQVAAKEGITLDDDPQVWRFGSGRLLLSASCGHGAYNHPRGYWIANEQPPHQAQFVGQATEYDGNGTLTAAFKGRGLGDCWNFDEWVWDGRQFAHTGSSSTGLCRGVAAGGAWSLPTLVTEVQRPGKN